MFISIPTPTADESCSEPSDVKTLDDLIFTDSQGVQRSEYITKGMDIRDYSGGDIYRYSLDKRVAAYPYKETRHNVGDIVVRNGHHHIIEEASHTNTTATWGYKQPEDYDDHETQLKDFESWTARYTKFPKRSFIVTKNNRTYYLQYTHLNSCGSKTSHIYRVRDNSAKCGPADPCTGQKPSCHQNSYTCLQHNISYKYDPAKDVRGEKKRWNATGGVPENTIFLKSAVGRGDFWYFRTHINTPAEKIQLSAASNTSEYITRRIYSPEEINGFRYNRKTKCFAAFDDKNYTEAVFNPSKGFVDFNFSISDWTDTFSLGRVFAESVSVTVVDPHGAKIFHIDRYPVDNEIADTTIGQSSNVVLYGDQVFPPNCKVFIRLYGGWIHIGRILVGRKLEVGFTNTLFDNGFKDFSPKEQDQWGSIEYKNGHRVYTHAGTVDLLLKDYDAVLRAFMYIGGREMIINGSDSINNTPTNSITIFQSTMMIGRFTAFKQKTKNVGGIMDNVATFSFAIEESV